MQMPRAQRAVEDGAEVQGRREHLPFRSRKNAQVAARARTPRHVVQADIRIGLLREPLHE